jgi:aarF domain-containing kinase
LICFIDIDINLITSIIHSIQYLFPSFQLTWLADELAISLPQELNFLLECQNAERMANFLKRSPTVHVPRVLKATKKIIVMQHVDGAHIDDLKFLNQHDISPVQVSTVLTELYNDMMFSFR